MANRWSTFRPALVLVALIGITLPAHAIFRGHLSDDIRRVMAVGRWNVPEVQTGISSQHDGKIMHDSKQRPLIATTSVISHEGIDQRCMLTARHVEPGDEENPLWHRVVMDANVIRLTPKKPDQRIAVSGKIRPDDGHDTYRDIRVNWLENKLDDDHGTDDPADDDIRIHLGDYLGVPIQPAPVDGLAHDEEEEDEGYRITGYGHNHDDAGVPDGLGRQRVGDKMSITRVDEREGPKPGARARTLHRPRPRAHAHSECYGDSGASMELGERTLFSVVSAGVPVPCDPAGRADYWDLNPVEGIESDPGAQPDADTLPQPPPDDLPAGLLGETVLHTLLHSNGVEVVDPQDTDWSEVGTWEQVKYLIAETCTKEMKFSVSGRGYITGQLDTTIQPYETHRLDHDIDCDEDGRLVESIGDCVEAVHQEDVLNVVAEPDDTDWVFLEWQAPMTATLDDGTEFEPNCPCEGQRAQCEIEFTPIGEYGPDRSVDVSWCTALFVPVATPPPWGHGGLHVLP